MIQQSVKDAVIYIRATLFRRRIRLAYAPMMLFSLRRESRAVSRGMEHHEALTSSGRQVFAVRRKLHMLEKGLTMIPRRDTFATGYIEALVASVIRLRSVDALGRAADGWAQDVLDSYFSATDHSNSQQIQDARKIWIASTGEAKVDDVGRPYHGPVVVGDISSWGDLPSIKQLEALAGTRRSVRHFLDLRVPRNCIEQALQVAVEAPSACNRVPYNFFIFTDPELCEQVASLAGGTAGYADGIPALAVVVGDLSAYSEPRDRHLIYIDASLASMSFLLALQAMGIASCCINWPDVGRREERMARLLELRPYERVIMLIAFGYPSPEALSPGSAKPELHQFSTFSSF